jgi:hypothetical protein
MAFRQTIAAKIYGLAKRPPARVKVKNGAGASQRRSGYLYPSAGDHMVFLGSLTMNDDVNSGEYTDTVGALVSPYYRRAKGSASEIRAHFVTCEPWTSLNVLSVPLSVSYL